MPFVKPAKIVFFLSAVKCVTGKSLIFQSLNSLPVPNAFLLPKTQLLFLC